MKKVSPNNQTSLNSSGFTIIELMIATAVFAVILMIIVYGIISITKTYTKGITLTNTQNIARNIANDISQSIQFDGCNGSSGSCQTQANPVAGNIYNFCVGSREYLYQVGYEVEPTLDLSSHQVLNGLVVVYNYGSGNCPNSINIPTTTSFQSTPLSTLFPGATEFLNSNMRLSYLNVSPLGANNLYNIDVEVTYGDDGVLLNGTATSTNGTTRCAGTVTNQDFCGTAKLDTVVESRVD